MEEQTPPTKESEPGVQQRRAMDEVQPQLERGEGRGAEERLPLCRGAGHPASLCDENHHTERVKGQEWKTGQRDSRSGGQVQEGSRVEGQLQQEEGEHVQLSSTMEGQLLQGTREQVQLGSVVEGQLPQEGGGQVQQGVGTKGLLHQEPEIEGQVLQYKYFGIEEQEQKFGLKEQRNPSTEEEGGKEPRVEEKLYAEVKEALEPEARRRKQSPPGTGEEGEEKQCRAKEQEESLRERAASKNEAHHNTFFLASDNIPEVKELEDTIEEMLMRLDEFCGMTDMVRNETSQLLDEDIHAINTKVKEMNKVYAKVDKLEAFVKMVGRHVTFLEEQLVQAEQDHQPFPNMVHKLLQSANIPSFIYRHSAKPQSYELPDLYRTEDYIPLGFLATKHRKT